MESYKNHTIYKALVELDEEMFKLGVKPFEINVIGGFALLLDTVSQINNKDKTDIDFIDHRLSFTEEFKEIIERIGLDYGIGRGWINCPLYITEDDLVYTFGKLSFKRAFDLKVISVNTIGKRDILKMKIVSLLGALDEIEVFGSSTRLEKDILDIINIMEELGIEKDTNSLVNELRDLPEFSSFMYSNLLSILRYSFKHGIKDIQDVAKNTLSVEGFAFS